VEFEDERNRGGSVVLSVTSMTVSEGGGPISGVEVKWGFAG